MATVAINEDAIRRAWWQAEDRYEAALVRAYGMDEAGAAWHDARGTATPELRAKRDAFHQAAKRWFDYLESC